MEHGKSSSTAKSVTSRGSRASGSRASVYSERRAIAEAARVRLEYAKLEFDMKKKIASAEEHQRITDARTKRLKEEFIAEIGLLEHKKEAAAAEAEASCLEQYTTLSEAPPSEISDLGIPCQDPNERSGEYIQNLSNQDPNERSGEYIQNLSNHESEVPNIQNNIQNDRNNSTDILTSFLLRKDLMPQRLSKFNDTPQSFGVWKSTFQSVTNELRVTPFEEIDLLVNHLGAESQKWAESLRASNPSNPERGLELIWERLNECYGSPEKIEFSLKSRIEQFPVLSNKDNNKLYELSDLLLELESVKSDSKFCSQFAVYDSSSGVNTIVRKLPYNLQQKWISTASKYKNEYGVTFPPFTVFVRFVREMSKVRNDPAFQLEQSPANHSSVRQKVVANTGTINTRKTVCDSKDSSENLDCPIHNSKTHCLTECKTFAKKPWEERREFLKGKGLCFRCWLSRDHLAAQCPSRTSKDNVSSKCTSLCGQNFQGRSCGKIVPVDVAGSGKTMRIYAILDDQSNRSLIGPELCEQLNITGEVADYTMSSCSGSTLMAGRRVSGLSISSLDGSVNFKLPTLIECDAIPQDISEIPTPEVALGFPHLKKIASSIPPLERNCSIQLLIGRDLPAAHHVMDQIIGPRESPFAVHLPLGWVVIGEICLGRVHKPNSVHTYFTDIQLNKRSTIFEPCNSYLSVKEPTFFGDNIFRKFSDDNKVGMSAEDRDFLRVMDQEFKMDDSGLWMAPLPFKSTRPLLPDNRVQAFKRAVMLKRSLEKDPRKCQHLVKFMEKIFRSGAAEIAPDITDVGKELWYLPLFGVYHPKKRDQIRGVFDSSVIYQGKSLNDVLVSGPNLTNSLLGVLLRFRRDKYAISADIEQMFYRFLVNTEHRDFLRFFWFENNNPERPLSIFRMRVHVFGNKPSPAVATYGLRKSVQTADPDVQQFVARDFYVDDALTSRPSRDEAISLLKRTRKTLNENGNIHLHKIASNDVEIMNYFPKEELNSNLKDLDMDNTPPTQQSLGLTWDLDCDMFIFNAPSVNRPFTRRGLLSTMNSVFDPMGFVAPFSICGKILLREACSASGSSWDDPLPATILENWVKWKNNLQQLNGYKIPRMYISDSLSLVQNICVHVYSDASESAIAAVAYVVLDSPNNDRIGFIMGKAKLAPQNGHSIPRLELCAAVLATEVSSVISEQLDIPSSAFKFFSDSKVVLGYIHNRTRRFYTYVSNRVAQICAFSQPEQWNYVSTEINPADAATRMSQENVRTLLDKWLLGPSYFRVDHAFAPHVEDFPIQDGDVEIRPEIIVKSTKLRFRPVISARLERFSSWNNLMAAFGILIHIVKTYAGKQREECVGWHLCRDSESPASRDIAYQFILSELQMEHYSEEIHALKAHRLIPKNSSILKLSPYLDESGILRLGGRLRHAGKDLGIASVNPIIVPKGHVAMLLARHYHEQTSHQGRHITEGAIRSNGLWIIGAKRLVCSMIHKCVTCNKLRGTLLQQKMADLPKDRLSPGPPFTSVGVDVFGHWEIITRKTRGGAANSKRWAVMFTCLTTRAAHIEVLEDMSASCFINALRRFISIRGPVSVIRSDRGTNFISAADCINAHVVNVEDKTVKRYLDSNGITWYFNPPHASHMGGVWERAIGVARRILDSMLLNNPQRNLTHEVLCTFMAEVTAIMNSRPIVPVDTDTRDPLILSPNLLLTQKQGGITAPPVELSLKDGYTAQWKLVQILSDTFWKQWRERYLDQLQNRRKWQTEYPNLKKGDVVLLRDKAQHRNSWPMAIVEEPISSDDTLVRKATVRYLKDDRMVTYTRPISEMVLLLHD